MAIPDDERDNTETQCPDQGSKHGSRQGRGEVLPAKAERESECDDSGVDRTLIRWMLSLTPGERLAFLQRNANAILRLRADNPDAHR